MRKNYSALLSKASIDFTKDRPNPSFTIHFPTMLAYLEQENISRPVQAQQYMSKESFVDGHVGNTYYDLEMINVEKYVLNAVASLKPNLKKAVLALLCSKLMKGSSAAHTSDLDTYIVDSMSSFLGSLQGDNKGSLPKMYPETKRALVAAALYNFGHSDHQYDTENIKKVNFTSISKRLKVSRKYVRNVYNDTVCKQEVVVEPEPEYIPPVTVSDAMTTDDDAYVTNIIDEYELNNDDEMVEPDDDQSDSSSTFSEDDNPPVYNGPYCAEVSDIVYRIYRRRKLKSDAINLTPVRWFWLNNIYVQINTNSSKVKNCHVGEGEYEIHPRRLLKVSPVEVFKLYNSMRETKGWPKVGYSLFLRARCACIDYDILRKCVDEKMVTVEAYLKGWNEVTEYAARLKCPCPWHAVDEDGSSLAKSINSISTLNAVLLCPPVPLATAADRSDRFVITKEQRDDAIRKNTEHANKKQKTSSSTSSSSSQPPPKNQQLHIKVPTIQHKSLKNHPYKCAHIKCDTCKVKSLPTLLESCPLFNESTHTIKHKKYVPIGSKTNLELSTVESTIPKFIKEFSLAVLQYIPHHWNVANDSFMRHRLIEELPLNCILVMTDFSAHLLLLGQDSLTCVHPKNAVQDVFVVLYITLDANGNRVYNTHSWHMWGDKLTDTVDNNTAFHAAGLDHIIQYYKVLLPTLYSEGKLDNVFINTDGCGSQYKNRYNASYVTSLCDRHDLINVVHTYAPTANFKCCCDAAGADTKRFYRQYELNSGGDHCGNAYMVYKLLAERMPQPPPPTKSSGMMSFNKRKHCCVYDESQITLHDIDVSDKNAILLNDKQFYITHTGKCVEGIKSMYQIRSTKQSNGERVVYCRQIHCSCPACLQFTYIDCVYTGEGDPIRWQRLDLKPKPKKTRKVNNVTAAAEPAAPCTTL